MFQNEKQEAKKSVYNEAREVDLKAVEELFSFYGEYSSSCIWGEWGSYAPCDEILTNVCKRLRVREPKNPGDCFSFNIDVRECPCEGAKRVQKGKFIFNDQLKNKLTKEELKGSKEVIVNRIVGLIKHISQMVGIQLEEC